MPKAFDDYKEKEYSFKFGQFNPLDRFYFYRQSSDLLCKDVLQSSTNENKMQLDVQNMEKFLNTENVDSKPNNSISKSWRVILFHNGLTQVISPLYHPSYSINIIRFLY